MNIRRAHTYKLLRQTKTKLLNISTAVILALSSIVGSAAPLFAAQTVGATGTCSTISGPFTQTFGTKTGVITPATSEYWTKDHTTTHTNPAAGWTHHDAAPEYWVSIFPPFEITHTAPSPYYAWAYVYHPGSPEYWTKGFTTTYTDPAAGWTYHPALPEVDGSVTDYDHWIWNTKNATYASVTPETDGYNWDVTATSGYVLSSIATHYTHSSSHTTHYTTQTTATLLSPFGNSITSADICVHALDTTPPTITAHIDPTPNSNGWNNTSTTLTWTVTDNESDVTSKTDCDTQSLTTDTAAAGTSFTCSATSAGGHGSQTATVKIDKDKPVISYAVTPTSPTNGTVTVNFSCIDGLSGIDSSNTNLVASKVVAANGTVDSEGDCYDLAGNKADAIHVAVSNIDKSAPHIYIKGNGNAYTPASIGSFAYGYYRTANLKINDNSNSYYTINGGSNVHRSGTWVDVNGISVGSAGSNGGTGVGVYGTNTVTAYDTAGNSSSTQFVLDNVAPTITPKDSSVGSTTTDVYSKADFKLYDDYLIHTWSVNGGCLHTQSPNKWSDANDIAVGTNCGTAGWNTLTATDQAGNQSTYNFFLDNVGPSIYLKGKNNAYTPASIGSFSQDIYSQVSFKLFDANKIDKYQVNAGAVHNQSDNTWSDANYISVGHNDGVAGWNNITVWDVAGNSTTYAFFLDNTAPTITVKDGYVGNLADNVFSNVSFKLHDTHQVDKYTLNAGTPNEWVSDFTNNTWSDANFSNIKSHLHEGLNTITLYDIAGNSTEYDFTYDGIAPNVTINGYGTTDNQIQPDVTASDNLAAGGDLTYLWTTTVADSKVSISNVKALNPVFSVHNDGTYTFTLTVTDQAGNATSKDFSFTYATPPSNPSSATNGFATVATTIHGGGTPTSPTPLTDNGSGTTTPEVLGDSITGSGSHGHIAGDSVTIKNASDKKSSKFLGLGWWWLLILAAIALVLWLLLAGRRSEKE